MRLLRADTNELIFETVHDDRHKYAILSQRWLAEDEEVTFTDILKNSNNTTNGLRTKAGWKKLQWCRQQAVQDGLRYIWTDTACIDKSSSQELTESINAMYRWYQGAEVCYVYLHDMPDRHIPAASAENDVDGGAVGSIVTATMRSIHQSSVECADYAFVSNAEFEIADEEATSLPDHNSPADLESQLPPHSTRMATLIPPSKALDGWDRNDFARAECFTRAWTLQEMLAPAKLRFYSRSWTLIVELQEIASDIAVITRVHKEALTKQRSLKSYSIAQKMSWAANRQCTKIEDQAYSLLGIMNVAMLVNYGEGDKSFQRLQDELLKSSSDDSIFAFRGARKAVTIKRYQAIPNPDIGRCTEVKATCLLADSPRAFENCGDISLADWRKDSVQHQVVGREVNFRMRMIQLSNRDIPPTQYHVHITRCQAVLQCYQEQSPSRVMVFNLVTLKDQPGVFYVKAFDHHSIAEPRIYDELKRRCRMESFSVVRDPEEIGASSRRG